jgi:hypothetical protein
MISEACADPDRLVPNPRHREVSGDSDEVADYRSRLRPLPAGFPNVDEDRLGHVLGRIAAAKE